MNSTLILSNPMSPRSPIQASAGTATFPSQARVSSSAPGSLYEVLKVMHNASQTEIKAAYRSLAKVYHPDVIKEMDGRDFLEIQNAYTTLADPAARASYDLSLFLVGRQQQQTPRLNTNFVRRQNGNSRVGYPTARRWETDQCW